MVFMSRNIAIYFPSNVFRYQAMYSDLLSDSVIVLACLRLLTFSDGKAARNATSVVKV